MNNYLPRLEGRSNPCNCCPPIPGVACLTKIVAVGFGSATAECDGETVADGEHCIFIEDGKIRKVEDYITFADIEAMAAQKPDSDWRIHLHGPLHGEIYQRQGVGEWYLVEKDNGFA